MHTERGKERWVAHAEVVLAGGITLQLLRQPREHQHSGRRIDVHQLDAILQRVERHIARGVFERACVDVGGQEVPVIGGHAQQRIDARGTCK